MPEIYKGGNIMPGNQKKEKFENFIETNIDHNVIFL